MLYPYICDVALFIYIDTALQMLLYVHYVDTVPSPSLAALPPLDIPQATRTDHTFTGITLSLGSHFHWDHICQPITMSHSCSCTVHHQPIARLPITRAAVVHSSTPQAYHSTTTHTCSSTILHEPNTRLPLKHAAVQYYHT